MDQRAIRANTFVQTIEHRVTIDSTNRLAVELLADRPSLPLLVSADEQTAGRGRGNNAWWSAPGSLTFTVVIDRSETSLSLPPYSLLTGLAVRDALQSFLPQQDIRVKWPNDVYIADRKVAGILVEIPPGRPQTLVIGIGINVNNSFGNAPISLRTTATSLVDLNESPLDRQAVLVSVLRRLSNELSDGVTAELPVRWSRHCALSGRTVTIQRGDRLDTGQCVGIDETGALLLTTDEADIAVSSGVVVEFGARPD